MAVLIKEMTLPESCIQCKMQKYSTYYNSDVCCVTAKPIPFYADNQKHPLPDWCPLEEVKEDG